MKVLLANGIGGWVDQSLFLLGLLRDQTWYCCSEDREQTLKPMFSMVLALLYYGRSNF
jgi:hypothetical protein